MGKGGVQRTIEKESKKNAKFWDICADRDSNPEPGHSRHCVGSPDFTLKPSAHEGTRVVDMVYVPTFPDLG